MLTPAMKGANLLLDACCIINLFATGHVEEILAVLPYDFATSRLIVEKEVLSIALPSGTGTLVRVIQPAQLENLPKLSVIDLSGDEELNLFIRFAAQLDDGEASVCALAVARGGALATDDRKAIRLVAAALPEVHVVQTPELLYQWVQLQGIPDSKVRGVLQSVEKNARFRPRRDSPYADWWEKLCT
jgi:predicted nucleic acid-binding protein